MKNKILATVAKITLLSGCATTAFADNLSQVYQHAKAHDAQLGYQEADFLAALEDNSVAESARNTQISMNGRLVENYTHIFNDASPTNTVDDLFNLTGNYTVSVSKPLYNPQIDRRISQARAGIEQAHAGLQEQRQGLIMRVATRYFDFLSAEDNLKFIRDERTSVKRRLAQVTAFFEAGRSAITGVREAQAKYQLTLSQEINASKDVAVAREALRVLTGRSYQSLAATRPTLRLAKTSSLSTWLKIAKQNNKALHTKQQAIKVAQAELALNRQGNAPSVNLIATHSGSFIEGDAPLDTSSADLNVGVEASIPFYSGGTTAAKVRQAKQKLVSAEKQYQYQLYLTEEKVRSAYLTFNSSMAFFKATKQSLIAAETALKSSQAGFEVGLRTASDVLSMQSALSNARFTESKARNDYLLSRLNLKAVAGTLSESDLFGIDRMLAYK